MEKHIERKVRKLVKDLGGELYKFVSPGYNGMPDRLLVLIDRPPVFIEFKDKGKKLQPLQQARLEELEALGQVVKWFDNYEDAEAFIHNYNDGI